MFEISPQSINYRWLTGEEEARPLEACPEWLRELVLFATNTGMRLGEMLEPVTPAV